MQLQLLASALLCAGVCARSQLSCRDSSGAAVDWFVMMKRPESSQFVYVTSQRPDSWSCDAECNVSRSGPARRTLLQDRAAADIVVAYNDERPHSRHYSMREGHMKGVAMLGTYGGFWLVHSVPKFPDLRAGGYAYPHSGLKYGQSFLCVSVGADAVGDIGEQLWVTQPGIYDFRISDAMLRRYAAWRKLRNNDTLPAGATNSTVAIRSAAGASFSHVAKSRHWRRDLYDSLLAPQLGADLLVESWQHGPDLLGSNCSAKFTVSKILGVRFGGGVGSFSSELDHSKWCVSERGGFVCVGDMNRALTQFRRGGGALCFRQPAVHRLLFHAVASADNCDVGEFHDGLFWLLLLLLAACSVALVTGGCLIVLCRLAIRVSGGGYQSI